MEALILLGGYVIGLTLLISEVFLPGLVLGITGSVILVYSIYESFKHDIWLGGGEVITALIVLPVMIFIALRKMTHKNVILNSLQETASLRALIGKEGSVVHDLKPSGTVEIEGNNYTARTLVGYIKKESKIEVLDVDGKTLIVERKS